MSVRIAVLLIACYSLNVAALPCPPGWTEYNNYCYRFFRYKKSWYEAQTFCDTVGAHGFSTGSLYRSSELTSISNSAEQHFLYYYWQSCQTGERAIWIGLHDPRHIRIFRWVDGSSLHYTNWNSGEPNNINNVGEYYGTMLSNSKWNDEHASPSNKFGFICKMPRRGSSNC